MKWFEGEMVAFDLSAGEQGFPDSVSKQTCSKSRITSEVVESPGGLSPPGAPRTVREPLDSYGSRCSAVAMA